MTELNLEGVEMSGDPMAVASRATDDIEKREEIARVLIALDDLPTGTTLERAVGDHLRGGGHWYGVSGWLPL